MKQDALTVAANYINDYFPNADVAIVGGSVVRGEGTENSDLDIFVCGDFSEAPYRKSLIYQEWPIEVFVHDKVTYLNFYSIDAFEGRATLPRIVSEGYVIKDRGMAEKIKDEANQVLAKGPIPWTEKELMIKQYFLTDLLDDFEGCTKREEGIYIAGKLAESSHEFLLRTNGSWTGHSKWIPRAMRKFDPDEAEALTLALDDYYVKNEKASLIQYVDQLLAKHGGRLFDGFYLR